MDCETNCKVYLCSTGCKGATAIFDIINQIWVNFFLGGGGRLWGLDHFRQSLMGTSASCGTDDTETIGFFSVNLLKQIYILVFLRNLKLFISNKGWQPF